MCGIIAYLGARSGGKIILEGIKILRNRGYDSIGCASIVESPDPSHFASGSSVVSGEVSGGAGGGGVGKTNGILIDKWATIPGRKDSFDLVSDVFDQHADSHCSMAHCRWATTGVVSDLNSHPHLDTILGKIALVHNGIISNYQQVKKFLMDQGVRFQSETDTEVIVNLIAHYYQIKTAGGGSSSGMGGGGTGSSPKMGARTSSMGGNLSDAIKLAVADLEGTWAIVVMCQDDPSTLYVSKKGSPIVIGYSDEMCIVSSETSGFSNYLKNYHVMPDNHLLKISLVHSVGGSSKIVFLRDGRMTELSTKELIHQTIHATSPDPFPHWTLKEIFEQPEAAFRALNQGGRLFGKNEVRLGGLNSHTERLMSIKHLTLIASGTSRHAGLIGQKFFQMLGGFDWVQVIDASEFSLTDLGRLPNHGVLLLSQSGETRDVYQCLEMIRESRPEVFIFSIVNVVESLIARESDCGVYLNAGREVGVASTKSFTNQIVVLALLSVWFAQKRQELPLLREKMVASLHNLPGLISETLTSIRPACEAIVDHLVDQLKVNAHLFILGKDRGVFVAHEGALKIKEISYIHAEAYPAGGLKHGPLALISSGTPVIVIREGDVRRLDIAAEETKTRGAYVIAVSSSDDLTRESDGSHVGHEGLYGGIYDQVIPISGDPFMYPILATLPLQYLAYLLSVRLGYNPDYPRNLAKCVTVE